MEEYDEYVALASRWGTGQLESWGYDYNYVVDGTFHLADNNKVHCLLPTFEEWHVLPVYECYHLLIVPQAQQPWLIMNGHLITSNLCWCTSKQASENRAFLHH